MNTVDTTIKYIFVLSLVLILVAYYVGTTAVGQTLFAGANQTILTSTGRNAQGNFAPYPTGG